LPIPIFYPAVELATGVFWALAFGYYGLSVEALRAAVFAMILLGIAVSDGRDFIIPDEFSIGGAVVGLLLAFAGGQISWQQSLLGAGVGIFLLWGVAVLGTKLFRKEAMGFGDVKMMAMLGAFLGWQQVLLTLFLASVIGVIIYLPMKLAGKERLVPFGVFLALGGATCWIVGPSLIDWYVGTLGLR
jgi:leader peptidase (prepilin peptidase)/N-methyltransferase